MHRLVTRTRRHVLLALTVALVAAGSAYAAGAGPHPGAGAARSARPPARLYACVTGDFHTLNLTTRGARCPDGQAKIAWNVRGVRGPAGRRGKAGAAGPHGDTGPAGPQGERGPAGPQGATGATGPQGPQGDTGPQGADGAPGAPGAAGADGAPGAAGATGPAGPSMFTSSSPATLTTVAGGLAGTATFLPLSGARESAATANAGSPPFAAEQIVPDDVTVTSLRLEGRLTGALSLVGTTVTVQAQLLRNGSPTVLTCTATPSLTGVLAIDTAFSASCTGFSLALTAGDLATVQVEATATGVSLIDTVAADVAVGIGTS